MTPTGTACSAASICRICAPAMYEQLIQAEYLADKCAEIVRAPVLQGPGARETEKDQTTPAWLEIEQGDFDRDGSDEVMMNSELLNSFIDPAEGGRITELDWKPRSFNLTNTLTRRREGYHEKILNAVKDAAAGPPATAQRPFTNAWRSRKRACSTICSMTGMPGVRSSTISWGRAWTWRASCGRNITRPAISCWGPTAWRPGERAAPRSSSLERERHGRRPGRQPAEGAAPALGSSAEFLARYAITNLGNEELNTTFGSEFNFSLLAGNAHDRYYDIPGHTLDKRNLASTGETNNVDQVSLVDEWLRLKLSLLFSQPAVLWRAPVETVSQSEAGFERVYQSSMVMPLWRISLGAGATWETEIRVKVE